MSSDLERQRREALHTRSAFQAALLRATHEATPDGVLVVGADGRMLTWNARFPALWGIPDEVLRTGSDDAALESVLDKLVDPDAFIARVRELYADPVPARDELRLRDGRVFDRFGTPLTGDDGTYHGYAWYIRDVTADRQGRHALLASEARYRSLARAFSNEVWRTSVTGELVTDMPAWRAVTGQTPEELFGWGWLDGVHADDRDRVAAAWRDAVHTDGMFEAEYRIRPVRDGGGADARTLAVRGVPIDRDGAVSEWVGVYTDVTELRAAEAAKDHLAALASAAGERTRALQEVTAALSSAVSMSDVLAVILDKGQTTLGASGGGVALRRGDRMHYEMLKGYSADIKAAWADFPLDESLPVTHVMRSGKPIFVESRAELLDFYANERLQSFVEATGEHSWARLPLITPSGVLGVLIFGFDRPRGFSDDERNFALALAGQCAQAIERARLYERERSSARLMQRSLLPDALPVVAGVQLSALCQPASADVEVGGDWYDALVLHDGRLVVVVGDVIGKGVRAASVLGQVRNALRGLVHADPSPAAVLGWLDAVVSGLGNDEELVTVIYGIFDPRTGAFEWGSAGHMPPLLLGLDEVSFVEGGEALPLGLGGDRSVGRICLEPGAALLLFSDGLVESRRRPLVDGLAQLSAHAEELVFLGRLPDAPAIRDQLTAAMVDVSDDDDVTVLVLSRSPAQDAVAPVRVAETVLPGRPTSAGLARVFVNDRLVEWGLQHLADPVLLCVSEIVTNAVVHAGSFAELTVHTDGNILRVEVRDSGGGDISPTRPVAAAEDTHGRGLLLVEAVSDRWGSVDEGDGKVVWFELTARRS